MENARDDRLYDFVLYGATGFTGQLVAQYLAAHDETKDLNWAIGGRNEAKLEALRAELGLRADDLPLILADSMDPDSLTEMAQQTQVICSTVGPYATYGSHLVAACVDAATDYCDLTGEVHWIRKMVDAHHERAKQTGARIVHCCGFDSIPSDLGTLMLQNHAQQTYGAACDEIRMLVWHLKGAVSGGTVASMATTMAEGAKDPELRRLLANPYALSPGESGPDKAFQQGPRHDTIADTWTGPFVMAVVNEKVVRRSNTLFEHAYGDQFRYSEAFRMGSGARGALRATTFAAGFGAFATAMAIGPTRKLLRRHVLPDPGEGPDKAARDAGGFQVRLFGRGTDADGQDFQITGHVAADADPGYGATSLMLGESCLTLANDPVEDGLPSGVLTPATALGQPLIERLNRAGMTLQIDS